MSYQGSHNEFPSNFHEVTIKLPTIQFIFIIFSKDEGSIHSAEPGRSTQQCDKIQASYVL